MGWWTIPIVGAYSLCWYIGVLCWNADSVGWALFWWAISAGGFWKFLLGPWFETIRRDFAAERQQARFRRQQKEAEQQRIVSAMLTCDARATNIAQSINTHLANASRHLSAAEVEFSERAFTPFWTATEAAAAAIGHFGDDIDEVTNLATEYARCLTACEQSPPPFTLTTESLPERNTARPLIEHLDRLVRAGHKDYQFATIYEQRRTTRTLQLGLMDLRQAISEMSDSIDHSFRQLDASIDRLRRSTERGFDTLEGQMRDVTAAVQQASSERTIENRTLRNQLSRIRRKL